MPACSSHDSRVRTENVSGFDPQGDADLAAHTLLTGFVSTAGIGTAVCLLKSGGMVATQGIDGHHWPAMGEAPCPITLDLPKEFLAALPRLTC